MDALGFAAEQVVGAERAAAIEEAADRQVLWLSDQPAWPVLRSQLMLLAAAGRDPEGALAQGVSLGALDDAHDPAAVLSWRLESAGGRGPLPWLAGIPDRVREDPTWGSYLAARQDIVRDLAEQVRELAGSRPQPWLEGLAPPAGHRLTGQIAVWRAANGVPDTDLRPTGAEAVDAAAAAVGWQRHLELQLANETPEIRRLTAALHREIPQLAAIRTLPCWPGSWRRWSPRVWTSTTWWDALSPSVRCLTTTPPQPSSPGSRTLTDR